MFYLKKPGKASARHSERQGKARGRQGEGKGKARERPGERKASVGFKATIEGSRLTLAHLWKQRSRPPGNSMEGSWKPRGDFRKCINYAGIVFNDLIQGVQNCAGIV